jgi:hypothetical protein
VDRQADGVRVLLDGRLRDLLGGLVQAGVDDLVPGVSQGSRDDFRAAIVPIQAGLRDDYAVFLGHGVTECSRPTFEAGIMTGVATRRVHLRSPGVKTGSTIGPLGPFRGTLGIQWVVGSIAVGLILVLTGSWFFLREPQAPFEQVEAFTYEELGVGMAREALPGIYLGKPSEDTLYAIAEPVNCELELVPDGYVDCADRRFGLDGVGRKVSLTRLPVEVHQGAIFIDPSAAA